VIFDVTPASFTRKGILVICTTAVQRNHTSPTGEAARRTTQKEQLVSATVSRIYIQSVLSLRDAMRRQEGQTMTEYGVLLALIAVIVIASVAVLGNKISDVFTAVTGKF
jgi:pilus assembly protein Flp/PilA